MDEDLGPSSEPLGGACDRSPVLTWVASRLAGVLARGAVETLRGRGRERPRELTLPTLRADVIPMRVAAQRPAPADGVDSDEALITGAAGGDADALARLYDRYAPVLLSVGQRILGGRGDAEDLLHDVFVEVWQQAGDYSPERGSVKSWMFLRMRSRAIDRLRLASNKNVELGDSILATVTREPAEDPVLAPDRAQVRSTLQGLPPDQRVAIELAYFAGLSGAQIAMQLGVPLGTVKTRLALGMSKLRAAFGEGKEVGE
jgi:RNA polymerase sigma-70 factor (ECF subfamily)